MSKFDPDTPLVMAKFKTVLGFNLAAGTALAIVSEPSRAGEVTREVAERLFAAQIAKPKGQVYPTPVETKEQEAARLLGEAANPGPDADEDADLFVPQDDLVVWPEGTAKAGQKVTNDDLRDIADDEGVEIESDDNKADLQRKIMTARAIRAAGQDAQGNDREPEHPTE